MITITIESDRAEGRTTLAAVVEYLLKNLSNYQVVDRIEENLSRASEKVINKFADELTLSQIRGLHTRPVQIIVRNAAQ